MCATCGCDEKSEILGRKDVPVHEDGHMDEHGHERGPMHEHGPMDEHEHGDGHMHEHGPMDAHGDGHMHEHGHRHMHEGHGAQHHPAHDHGRRTVAFETAILAKNDRVAEANREWLFARSIAAVNLMSSPGAGKTTLLERTLRDLAGQYAVAVIEGDQATDRDAGRIRAAGARAIQINTGRGCHLDAGAVGEAILELEPVPRSLLFIENVGNLVCPALFDLGESARVVIASVTEGDDKPMKYPHMFRAADILVLNKIDLLPYVAFDSEAFFARAAQVKPGLRTFRLSATHGDGLGAWYGWLGDRLARAQAAGA
jgi:hydrogenase nickel incorporation protein HypB